MIPNKLLIPISRALWDTDLIASRIILAMGELFWAIMLFWPGDTFGRPTYTHMALIMSEVMWGFVFLLSAVSQLSIVSANNFHSVYARWFALWNMILWGFTVTSMLLSVYPPPAAIGGEIALAIAAGWIWLRPHLLVEGYIRAAR
jgi:hypothetical protein